MAQLLVRDLPEELVIELDRRAVKNGVSAEEELMRILKDVLSAKPKPRIADPFDDHLSAMPDVGEDWMFDRNDPRNSFGPQRPPIDLSDDK